VQLHNEKRLMKRGDGSRASFIFILRVLAGRCVKGEGRSANGQVNGIVFN
jgi:hypothetical protein